MGFKAGWVSGFLAAMALKLGDFDLYDLLRDQYLSREDD